MIPLLLLLIHLCCTLARLTIRVGGTIAVTLALPKQKTHKTATLARHRLHHINELKVFLPPFFFSPFPAFLLSLVTIPLFRSYSAPFASIISLYEIK